MSDDHKPADQEQLYVLRLWDEPPLTRGSHISVYHVGSGLRLHFASLTALLNYLDAHLDPRPDEPENPHLLTKENS